MGRSSKRLRGETVGVLSMFDDPEAAARRHRQAIQTDTGANPTSSPRLSPVVNLSRQPRAVHFQEPSALPNSPAAFQAEEDSQCLNDQHVDIMSLANGTPHVGVPDPGSAAASGLRLTLSASTSAAQPPDSAAPAALHLHSAQQSEGTGAQLPASLPSLHSTDQPADNSHDAAVHAVPDEDQPMPQAPTTAGRAVASSQDSLRIAAEQAAAIARAQALSRAAAAAGSCASISNLIAVGAAPIDEDQVQLVHPLNAAPSDNRQLARDCFDPSSRKSAAVLPGDAHVQTKDVVSLSMIASEARKHGEHQQGKHRQEEVWRSADSTVLASTTRPNMPETRRAMLPKPSLGRVVEVSCCTWAVRCSC